MRRIIPLLSIGLLCSPMAYAKSWVALTKSQSFTAESIQASYSSFGDIDTSWTGSIGGFSIETGKKQAKELEKREDILLVVPNETYYANQTPWGLDRIDDRTGLDGDYSVDSHGEGVNVFVVDSGINQSHEDFTGRIVSAMNFVDDRRGPEDCGGHGTHVASTIAGTKYGVANKANIFGLRVLNCRGSGSLSGIIKALNWVADNAELPAVVNMSLGGSKSRGYDEALSRLKSKGIHVVVAAGNSNRDACNYSPAGSPDAITVGSTGRSDRRSDFSNYGRCVDIFAPGENIPAAWIGSSTATNSISGTSMASPHVAGGVALYLALHPYSTLAETKNWLYNVAGQGLVSDAKTSNNRLLFVGNLEGDNLPEPKPEPKPEPNPEAFAILGAKGQSCNEACSSNGARALLFDTQALNSESACRNVLDQLSAPYADKAMRESTDSRYQTGCAVIDSSSRLGRRFSGRWYTTTDVTLDAKSFSFGGLMRACMCAQ